MKRSKKVMLTLFVPTMLALGCDYSSPPTHNPPGGAPWLWRTTHTPVGPSHLSRTANASSTKSNFRGDSTSDTSTLRSGFGRIGASFSSGS